MFLLFISYFVLFKLSSFVKDWYKISIYIVQFFHLSAKTSLIECCKYIFDQNVILILIFFHKVPFHHVISITYIRNFKRIFKPGTEALHRRPVPCFVVSQNSKQTQFQYHQKYRKYCVIIEFLFSQNNHSDSNFNWKFDYELSTLGLNSNPPLPHPPCWGPAFL